jgi:mannose-6-phosphate isomerase-like protein (cupin superfamily)
MAVTVQRKFFGSIGEALDDIRKNGTWPTTLVSGPSRGRQVHWHSEEVHAYVMEGETDFLDAATSERIPVGPGDKVVIPARALHAEGAVKDRVVYLIALPGPLPYDEFLKARPEEELRR